jgi:AraC-like DNA-binding protein
MSTTLADAPILSLSTSEWPEGQRVDLWREVYGRQMMRLEIAPEDDHPFCCELKLRRLPGLGLAWGISSPFTVGRTRELLADGDDSLVLQFSSAGGHASQWRREATVAPGDAVLFTNAEVGGFVFPADAHVLALNIPRAALAARLRDVESAIACPIARDTEALHLLLHYTDQLCDLALTRPELQRLTVTHVYDLVALALGGLLAARDTAALGGLRAARLAAVVAAIETGFADPGFGPAQVARALNVSPRYVQEILHATGISFTERVTELRLQRARAMLEARAQAKIIEIAHACGFNDVSYFNRCFRRRFGASPIALRGTAVEG